MRLGRSDRSSDRARQLSSEINEAALAKGVEGRVCSDDCTVKCPRCGSMACQCVCSVHCPEAPRALSVDPERYPIEPAILPLVFEMKRLGMFRPCWSCEGHPRPDGTLWKVPRVWFNCDSMVHIRLLADGLNQMTNAGRLVAPWQVVVTHSDSDNPETTFSIEPTLPPGAETSLSALQSDVATIARSLHALLNQGARKLQHKAAKTLADQG